MFAVSSAAGRNTGVHTQQIKVKKSRHNRLNSIKNCKERQRQTEGGDGRVHGSCSSSSSSSDGDGELCTVGHRVRERERG